MYTVAYTSGHHKTFLRGKPRPKAEIVLDVPPPSTPVVVQGNSSPRHGEPSARTMHSAFERVDYSLEAVARGETEVPRIELSAVPHDLQRIASTEDRKSVFLRMLLPLVLKANEEIRADRRRLRTLQRQMARHEPLSRSDSEWLADLAERYRLDPAVSFGRLLKRVDVVPPSLALAQAALESGWGTSRFARRGNALFGQWTSDTGMVPRERDDDKSHHVKTFATPLHAVEGYIHNLNTHNAYDEFRDERARQRTRGAEPDGRTLAGTLDGYAAKGPEYVEAVRRLMRHNDLESLDEARLSMEPAALTF
ncbi:MAG: glucosaminidase domain-containing protein [Alphaproteobacteria bacterium]